MSRYNPANATPSPLQSWRQFPPARTPYNPRRPQSASSQGPLKSWRQFPRLPGRSAQDPRNIGTGDPAIRARLSPNNPAYATPGPIQSWRQFAPRRPRPVNTPRPQPSWRQFPPARAPYEPRRPRPATTRGPLKSWRQFPKLPGRNARDPWKQQLESIAQRYMSIGPETSKRPAPIFEDPWLIDPGWRPKRPFPPMENPGKLIPLMTLDAVGGYDGQGESDTWGHGRGGSGTGTTKKPTKWDWINYGFGK